MNKAIGFRDVFEAYWLTLVGDKGSSDWNMVILTFLFLWQSVQEKKNEAVLNQSGFLFKENVKEVRISSFDVGVGVSMKSSCLLTVLEFFVASLWARMSGYFLFWFQLVMVILVSVRITRMEEAILILTYDLSSSRIVYCYWLLEYFELIYFFYVTN